MVPNETNYAVVFHGQRFILHSVERRWFFLLRERRLLVNFYTTRFVLARTLGEARSRASDLIEKEVEETFERASDSIIELHKISHVDSAYSGPGGGFTFYEPEEPED